MGFVKIGDNADILNYLDDNANEQFCPTCGKKLVAIQLGPDENKFVCVDCDIDEEEQSN